MAAPAPRVSELHKGAFWIYGVTAMVLRDPVSHILGHLDRTGLADWEVHLEILRLAVLLVLMARFFLSSGLVFDSVYMREYSAATYPRRSYPVDFLAGLGQFLLLEAAALSIGSRVRVHSEFAGFTLAVSLAVLYENLWYAITALLNLSTRGVIRPSRNYGNVMFACSAGVYVAARLVARADAVFADQAAFVVLLSLACYDVRRLIRRYGDTESPPGRLANG